MKNKVCSVIFSIMVIYIGLHIFFKSKKAMNDTSKFVVGTAAGYAPWVSINSDGEYEGFDIDVATILATEMGKKLIVKDLGSMSPLFMALEQESIDAIIWGLSITQDRLKQVAMIHYQGNLIHEYPLIFWKSIPPSIKSLDDMKNKTICVEPASAQDTVLSKYLHVNKLLTEKIDDALLNIQYGKADAAFVEQAIAKKFENKYQEIKILKIPLAPEDQVEGVGIVIKKSNLLLIQQVQKSIDHLKSAGKIKQLEKKWGLV